ncbi:NgoMIV family type II restriction endonuclease [Mycobacteroides abscessus]
MTNGVASNADADQRTSKVISAHIANKLGAKTIGAKLPGQRAGTQFERAVESLLAGLFPQLQSIRPGDWEIENVGGSRSEYQIAKYEPYTHLGELANAIEKNPTLSAVLGNSYDISPDIIITRNPESDDVINRDAYVVDDETGLSTVIRAANQEHRIVHAVVSCKWTLRSDRAQNARSEALGVIRNRKGRTPHIVVVTGEPTPSRLASLALGTGDVDMVYHFALPELVEGVKISGNDEAESLLDILIQGKRLRDIADLPLDLAV